jgi:hypothetical protein
MKSVKNICDAQVALVVITIMMRAAMTCQTRMILLCEAR